MTNKTKLKQLEDIKNQLEKLEQEKLGILDGAKAEAKEAIQAILSKTGFSIEDIYPQTSKKAPKSPKTTKSGNVPVVEIDGERFELPRRITEAVKTKLKAIGLDPTKYDKTALIAEFGVKQNLGNT